jgi:hypothetical protein
MRLVAALVGVIAFGSIAVRAEESAGELAGETLRSTVAGKTVFLATPVGSLPINYRTNGTMTGRAAHLAQFTGSESDSGRWWVNGGQLCQQWQVWLDGQQYCYVMRRNGATVHWSRDDGRTGTATISR